MKLIHHKLLFSTLLFFGLVVNISAQTPDKLWFKSTDFQNNSKTKVERRSTPNNYKVYNLDLESLTDKLKNTPQRKDKKATSNLIIDFPSASGEIENYEIFEASVLDEVLQKKYPSIKSYVGKNTTNSAETIRFSVSKIGLHAMILQNKEGAVFIDPFTTDHKSYMVYSKKEVPSINPFVCMFDDVNDKTTTAKTVLSSKSLNANDSQMRSYRLAIATTGEYSQFQLTYHGISSTATETEKKEAILSAINVTMTRVNAIFERDVSLTMKLVTDTDKVIFLDPNTDNLTNDDGSVLINESQTVIDANIGFNNYDIGHTFSTGGGGLAQLNSPCTSSKARGITGSSFPIGDTYDIDFVAHEMGHQFGANHTFNSNEGSCSGNKNDITSIEPGSGSTIMAYAGLCAPDNVQSQSDDYFHLVSIQEMWANISAGNSSSCATLTNTGNSAPVVNALNTYTIPISTPFALTAEASDPDSDTLTYTWEQLDPENAVAPPVATSIEGPSFRSITPSTSPTRYFPNQNTVIAGKLFDTWEVLPSVSRTMKFSVNVRDNNLSGGQSSSQETTITFDGTTGPFNVTSQTSSESWNSNESQTITWNIANTNNAPVNCSTVNILLSTDGGYTFPFELATNIPNNGTYTFSVPNITTNLGRIKVESVGNIFYAINKANLSIQAKEFQLDFSNSTAKVCKPSSAVYNFTYTTFLGFNEETTFSATGNPAGSTVTFSPTTATSNNTNIEVTVSGISNLTIGTYEINLKGVSATSAMEKSELVTLTVFDSTITTPTLTSPENNTVDLLNPFVFEWSADENAESYQIQLATDASFNSIVEENNTLTTNTFTANSLDFNTTYYWRVKSSNNCGESAFSEVFNFSTANVICNTYNSTDKSLEIPDNDPNGVNSIITVINNQTITDINVTVNITHPYVEDLTLTLTSPNGIAILLSVSNGGAGDNYTNTVFDDDATIKISDGFAPFTGSFIPQLPLANLNNIESKGDWTLNVADNGEADTGTILNWSLEICGLNIEVINDDDNDGITNDIDQCPNSTPGSKVNSVGCFTVAEGNFNIEGTGETCLGKANGQIVISTTETHNYTATINGTDYSFTNFQTINDLPAGTYDFCISINEENYEQCFTVVIETGATIAAKATISSNKAAIIISEGTAPFNILVNGKQVFKTSNTSFEIDVTHGDLVEVKTAIECEGVFSKNIDLIEGVLAYPNPSKGRFQITVPYSKKDITVKVYNVQSQLISTKNYSVYNGKILLNIEAVPTGVYFAKIMLDEPVSLKLIKQ
ncbi:Por secretion system C-terminal sorting domain-containing protein [Lutibacter agarilyticus]|uniref:Por secretion system C-terminal sorting domain-containing protein n=1 Tax=Lutibacter agarilyticus TaxID=1109740 RepID=A0A238VWJ3_9FLAO|nr:zinc-dependent metalloprotease family protein [Lutibacter agarilyticus]SNR37849.1 Por secretion system C-terminal sorting domain-containing protein [Lutibacter agarilyticus]